MLSELATLARLDILSVFSVESYATFSEQVRLLATMFAAWIGLKLLYSVNTQVNKLHV